MDYRSEIPIGHDQGKVREDQVMQLFYDANYYVQFISLPEKTREVVASGAQAVLRLDKKGANIRNEDEGYVKKANLENPYTGIRSEKDWEKLAVRGLVDLALSDDQNSRRLHANKILAICKAYIEGFEGVGKILNRQLPVSSSKERDGAITSMKMDVGKLENHELKYLYNRD